MSALSQDNCVCSLKQGDSDGAVFDRAVRLQKLYLANKNILKLRLHKDYRLTTRQFIKRRTSLVSVLLASEISVR